MRRCGSIVRRLLRLLGLRWRRGIPRMGCLLITSLEAPDTPVP